VVLSPHEVHVWRARWRALAPPAERARRRRALLKAILSQYLQIEPAAIRFVYNPAGKPSLDPDHRAAWLSFNVAHTADASVYAVTRGRQVGIDIEAVRSLPELEGIAAQFFTAREAALIRALPAPDRLDAFFTCWTRKEAYLKALGQGFTRAPNQVDVPAAGGPVFKLTTVAPYPGHLCTVAAAGSDWRISWRAWPPAPAPTLATALTPLAR
jgi:4'-phosphopantetheinyl transferase